MFLMNNFMDSGLLIAAYLILSVLFWAAIAIRRFILAFGAVIIAAFILLVSDILVVYFPGLEVDELFSYSLLIVVCVPIFLTLVVYCFLIFIENKRINRGM